MRNLLLAGSLLLLVGSARADGTAAPRAANAAPQAAQAAQAAHRPALGVVPGARVLSTDQKEAAEGGQQCTITIYREYLFGWLISQHSEVYCRGDGNI